MLFTLHKFCGYLIVTSNVYIFQLQWRCSLILFSLAWHSLNDYETNVVTFVSGLLFTSTFKMLLSVLNYIIGMLQCSQCSSEVSRLMKKAELTTLRCDRKSWNTLRYRVDFILIFDLGLVGNEATVSGFLLSYCKLWDDGYGGHRWLPHCLVHYDTSPWDEPSAF